MSTAWLDAHNEAQEPDEPAPRRVQRTRTRGGGMPEGAVYVGRPTAFGNPFKAGDSVYVTGSASKAGGAEWEDLTAERAVELYKGYVLGKPALLAKVRAELAGRDLACWCALVDENGQRVPCHADALLEIANG